MKKFWGLTLGTLLLFIPMILANDPPTQPTLLYPIGNEQLGERTNISWIPSTDPDGDFIHYIMDYSPNNGADWFILDDSIGLQTRFEDNTSEQIVTFNNVPQVFSVRLHKPSPLAVTRLNITAMNLTGITYGPMRDWKATTANTSVSLGVQAEYIRVWANLTGKINQTPSAITKVVIGLDTTNYPPIGRRQVRICTATNLTDGSCQTLLQQTSVDCDVWSNCREDPDFNYAFRIPVNLTFTNANELGKIIMIEITPPSWLFIGTVPRYSGLGAGIIRPGGIDRYYPDVRLRLEYSSIDIYNNTSPLTIDIGNDGSVEHIIGVREDVPVTAELSDAAFQDYLARCRAGYRDTCVIPFAVNASSYIVKFNALEFYSNISSYHWITNFIPLGTNYKLRIKASDRLNESSPFESPATFSIAYDPEECEQILTTGCNITRTTTLLYGDHPVNIIAINNNNTVLDCNGASLISANSDFALGLSIGGTTNVTVKNCVFKDYHTAITTQKPFHGQSSVLSYKEPAYNVTIVNNTFEGIVYASVYLLYTNWTAVFIPSQNRTGYRIHYSDTIENALPTVQENRFGFSIGAKDYPYFSVYVERYGSSLIKDNKIRGSAINLMNAPRARVLYNVIQDNSNAAIYIGGVMRINETRGNIIIYGNNITNNNDVGILIDGFNNIIVNNTIARNNIGFSLMSRRLSNPISLNNYFYANRMIDNAIQAEDQRNNTFDVLLMGNLWNNYMNDSQGCRDIRPPFGRCDDPYNIDPDSQDRFPIRQGVQFLVPTGVLESVYEIPPIITGVNAPTVVIAGDPIVVNVEAFGINQLVGLQITLDPSGNPYYTRPETYGVSDPVLFYDIDSSLFTRVNNTFTWQTNSSSAGLYNFTISVSDGETIKSRAVEIQVLPREAMLTIQGSPRIGRTITFSLLEPLQVNQTYVLALSFGNAPGIPLGDGRVIPLNYDPLLSLSVHYPTLIGLGNTVGIFDLQGRATASWTIPNVPELAGITVYAAFIAINPTLPFPQIIAVISPAVPITLIP